ncbi:TonB-dependent receptor plug domain-containing protein [Sphingobium sufflavum]|uniref:STN domain-containing protein n=1 Tax=Sphingobium sufflavum TaxID=1129547 RepID=UPI001F457EFE|nr:TonB-dependent receptor plug domain-containing protein [Sphingobium sufflavum]MCE7796580.1 TonB-dependent receptor plug domain-containing protein [Sphingobium sufflavum]
MAQATLTRVFDLPAEPLARALARYTRETGILVVADATLTRGQTSTATRGSFTTAEAFARLLLGTGLRAQPDGRSGLVIVRDTPRAQTQPAAPIATDSPDILVFGRLTRDTRMTIPQSVEVLDAAAIQSTGSDSVGDLLRFVPGASRDGSPLDAFGDTFLIRGFQANQTVNGIAPSKLNQPRDTISIDGVEVLRGPASVLYGQLQPARWSISSPSNPNGNGRATPASAMAAIRTGAARWT